MRTLLPLLLLASPALAQPKAEPPTVLLLGDSIRIGYAPLVAKKLDGIAKVVHPGAENGGDTATTLKNLAKWVGDHKPAVIHWNNGLHDLKLSKAKKTHQIPVEEYRKNLLEIGAALQKIAPARIIFANTTPIIDERHAKRKADFDRLDADVQKYNRAAEEFFAEVGIPVNNLYRIVQDGDPTKMLGADGTHYTPAGYDRLADAVADSIKRQLLQLTAPKAVTAKAGGPEAVAAYQKTEAELDAAVPEQFKKMKAPEFAVPKDADEWAKRRPDVRAKVIATLGDLPERPKKPLVKLVSAEKRTGYTLERLRIDNGVDGEMSALMLIPNKVRKVEPADWRDRISPERRADIPKTTWQPAPCILWLHSSSVDHNQLLIPNTNGGAEPLGETFIKAGYVVFAPDAAWYGDRAGVGPSGKVESTTNQHTTLHKYHLWFGRTLWGMFVRDDQVALDYLVTRPEVDAKRIGATGISMGSTRSWWLAAVDDRISCVVGVACLTRYENLLKHGQLKQHGVYYFVNGILKHFDTEAVVSLIAPRPVLFLTGDLDPGSPADGIKVIEAKAGGLFAAVGAKDQFKSVRYPDVAHVYTPEMRTEMLAWFAKWLK